MGSPLITVLFKLLKTRKSISVMDWCTPARLSFYWHACCLRYVRLRTLVKCLIPVRVLRRRSCSRLRRCRNRGPLTVWLLLNITYLLSRLDWMTRKLSSLALTCRRRRLVWITWLCVSMKVCIRWLNRPWYVVNSGLLVVKFVRWTRRCRCALLVLYWKLYTWLMTPGLCRTRRKLVRVLWLHSVQL